MKDYIKKTIGYKQTIELLKQGHIIRDYTLFDNGAYSIIFDNYNYSVRCDSFDKLLDNKIICMGHNLNYYTGYKSDGFITTYKLNNAL